MRAPRAALKVWCAPSARRHSIRQELRRASERRRGLREGVAGAEGRVDIYCPLVAIIVNQHQHSFSLSHSRTPSSGSGGGKTSLCSCKAPPPSSATLLPSRKIQIIHMQRASTRAPAEADNNAPLFFLFYFAPGDILLCPAALVFGASHGRISTWN